VHLRVPPETRLRRLPPLTGLLLVGAGLWGCGDFKGEGEDQRFAQRLSRRNAVQRRESRQRAEAVERELAAPLRPARRPFRGCAVEYRRRPQAERATVALACGDFGPSWPLRVSHGYMRCDHWPGVFDMGRVIVFTAPDGGEYAVNDAAHAVGYRKLRPLLRDPERPRLARHPLVERGLTLCG
jgi:hypothetical protein